MATGRSGVDTGGDVATNAQARIRTPALSWDAWSLPCASGSALSHPQPAGALLSTGQTLCGPGCSPPGLGTRLPPPPSAGGAQAPPGTRSLSFCSPGTCRGPWGGGQRPSGPPCGVVARGMLGRHSLPCTCRCAALSKEGGVCKGEGEPGRGRGGGRPWMLRAAAAWVTLRQRPGFRGLRGPCPSARALGSLGTAQAGDGCVPDSAPGL